MSDSGTEGSVAPTEVDRLTTLPKPGTPVDVRDRLLDMLRRDLVGPHPDYDPDLAREVLAGSSPSTWDLTGYLGPKQASRAEARAKSTVGAEGGELFGQEWRGAARPAAAHRGYVGEQPGERPRRRRRKRAAAIAQLRALHDGPLSPGLAPLRNGVRAPVLGRLRTDPRLDDAVFIPDKNEEARKNGEAPSPSRRRS